MQSTRPRPNRKYRRPFEEYVVEIGIALIVGCVLLAHYA